MASYLPPVIVRITGTDKGLIAALAEARAALLKFADGDYDAKLRATEATLMADLEQAVTSAQTFAKSHPINLQTEMPSTAAQAAQLTADIATLQAIADAHPITIPAHVSALGQILGTSLLGQLALPAAGGSTHIPNWALVNPGGEAILPNEPSSSAWFMPGFGGSGEGGSSAGWLTGLLGLLGGGGGGGGGLSGLLSLFGGGGGGGGGMTLSQLLWGGFHQSQSPLLGGGSLAGVGSVADIAGLGPESLIVGPALGLMGSAIGAAIGAGFLGLGAGGTMAVGMGTNAAGIGQGLNDLQKYRTALQQLNTAIGTYGKTSVQAAQAASHLNSVLQSFPAAVQGVTGPIATVSKTMTQMAALWDKLTGPAEAKGLHILTELFHVVETFFSTIGKFATQNMSILTKGIKPLFHWLETTGLQIFTNLEKVFQKNMPKGITALVNGLELLFKIVTDVAPQLGHFVTMIAGFLKKLNTKTQGKLKAFINTMISDFKAWFGFIKTLMGLGKTLLPLVAHLGKNLINTLLRPLVQSLRSWVQQTSSTFKSFFSAHNGLMMSISKVILSVMPAIEAMITAFMKMASVMRPGTAAAFDALAKVLNTIVSIGSSLGMLPSPSGKSGGGLPSHGFLGNFFGLHPAEWAITHLGQLFGFTTTGTPATPRQPRAGHGAHLTSLITGGSSSVATELRAQLLKALDPAKLAQTFDADFAKALKPGAADKAATALGKAVHHGVWAQLKATVLGHTFDQHLAGALKPGAAAAAAKKLGTDIHHGVWMELKAGPLGKTFTLHLATALKAGAGTQLEGTARKLGTDIHDGVRTHLKAATLGKTFDEDVAAAITANDSLVITAAKSLGAKAAAAFSSSVSSSASTAGLSTVVSRMKSGTVMR